MVPGLVVAVALAPLYWLLVPERHRREFLVAASLVGLGLIELRLLAGVLGLSVALFAAVRAMRAGRTGGAWAIALVGIAGLLALFAWNKLGGPASGVLPSQSGLLFLGVSYLVLKAVALLVEAARGRVSELRFSELLAWIVFLPTYPSGPIEELDHFRSQRPSFDRERVLKGLERILFGLVKALVLSHYLGVWAGPVLEAPGQHAAPVVLLAVYAFAVRFYLDFAGYSDIAIGLSALFGIEIQENFDNPLVRRNLVQLWQRWHMTLTRWLRSYIFLPTSRALLRRGGGRWDRTGIAFGQLATMVACGLWHGIGWNFAIWGALQGIGLVFVGVFARDLGRRLPAGLVGWWRASPIAYAASALLTFNAFAISGVFLFLDFDSALHTLRALVGA